MNKFPNERYKPLRIGIIGSGAAGLFMAAALARNCPGVDVTVIYDPNTPGLEVGESVAWHGTDFMHKYLGLENDFSWLKESGSTFKYAVALKQWHDESDDVYYMTSAYNPGQHALTASIWQNPRDTKFFDYQVGHSLYHLALHLHAKGLMDHENCIQQFCNEYWWFAKYNTCVHDRRGNSFTSDFGYAHHINADKIRFVIHDKVGKPHGVKELPKRVNDISFKENGDIDHLVLEDGSTFHADLFFDCSGFARLLAKRMNFNWVNLDEYWNNAAIVGRHVITDHNEYHANSIMAGMKWGWRFEFPMKGRTGNGYVFNSRIFNDEEVLANELRNNTGNHEIEFKRLSWTPGYHNEAFVNNCILLGISYWFSEVFDANNFSLALGHMMRIINELNDDPDRTFKWKKMYNTYVENLRRALELRITSAIHLARRNDTEYWHLMKEAAKKHDTEQKLIEGALDRNLQLFRPNIDGKGINGWVYVNQALYNQTPLPKERLILNVSEHIEQQAIAFFKYFKTSHELKARHSQSLPDFYRDLYPN